MSSVADFKREASARWGRNWQQWVTGSISHVVGLGHGPLTYLGCSKYVRKEEGGNSWHCRKRLGVVAEIMPNEILNHRYAHLGDCSMPVSGIQCFAMNVVVTDDSGSVRAEVWAPAAHLLGCTSSLWCLLDDEQKEQTLKVASKKQFDMLLMSVHAGRIFTHYKVQFVRPEKDDICPQVVFNGNINTLSVSLASLAVGAQSESESENTSEAGDNPAALGQLRKVEASVGLLLEAHQTNARAIKHLQTLVEELRGALGDACTS